jgi:hypothetical protein
MTKPTSLSGSQPTTLHVIDCEPVTSNMASPQPTANELEGIQDLLAEFANAAAIAPNASVVDWDAIFELTPESDFGAVANLSSVDDHIYRQENAFTDIPTAACTYFACLRIACFNRLFIEITVCTAHLASALPSLLSGAH